MRVRTEARRRAILDAARDVFEARGFERASMQMISERLGGSKATLYGYFPSKEELFLAVIEEDIKAEVGAAAERLRGIPDLREALEQLGRDHLRRVTERRPMSVRAMIAGLPPDSRLGLQFYERAIRDAWLKLCLYFEELIAAGRLRPCTAWVAAMHLKGMLEAEFMERRLLNALPADRLDDQTITRVSRDAVDAFLRAYGPEA